MEELNTTKTVETIAQPRYDTLTAIDLGEALALSQVAEDGTFHNVVIGTDQAEALAKFIIKVLG